MSEHSHLKFSEVTISQLNRWAEQGVKFEILWDRQEIRVPRVKAIQMWARPEELP